MTTMTCPTCGGPAVELLIGIACDACDGRLAKSEGQWSHWDNTPPPDFSFIEQVIRDVPLLNFARLPGDDESENLPRELMGPVPPIRQTALANGDVLAEWVGIDGTVSAQWIWPAAKRY